MDDPLAVERIYGSPWSKKLPDKKKSNFLIKDNKIKPFICPRCEQGFTVKSNMLRHYKFECGQPQRFECPYCQIRIRQKTHVWRHIKSRHPDCEIFCRDIFTNTKILPRQKNT